MNLKPCFLGQCIVSLCVVFGSTISFADTSLIMHMEHHGKNQTSPVYISNNKVRFDQGGQKGSYMIFDNSKQAMMIVEPAKRQYSVIDEEKLTQLMSMMNLLRQQMSSQMEGLPPEQRSQMEEALEQKIPGLSKEVKSANFKFEDVGEKGKYNNTPCTFKKVIKNGEPISKVCVASVSSLGIDQGDYETLNGFFEFMISFASKLPMGDQYTRSIKTWSTGLNGLPIYEKPVDGKGEGNQLMSVSKQKMAKNLFTIPKGYSEMEMGIPRQRAKKGNTIEAP